MLLVNHTDTPPVLRAQAYSDLAAHPALCEKKQMIVHPLDYIRHQEAQGRFVPSAALPECNAKVLREYLLLYDAHVGPSREIEILIPQHGPGLYRDPLAGPGPLNWALMGPVSHPALPYTADDIIKAAPFIEAALNGYAPDGAVTDTFVMQDSVNAAEASHFIWINSPRAVIHPSFEAYALSLSAPRRKQMRRLFRQYDDDPGIRFEWSSHPPGTAETDFILRHTYTRWRDDAAYALVQVLWPMAVSAVMPDAVRYMRVYKGRDLVFLNGYILRDDVLTSQSTTRNEDIFLSGLGVMIDFKAIALLSGQTAIRFLDPTCRTGLDDPESIGLAKREIVNSDALKPILAVAGQNLGGFPHYRQGWVIPDHTAPAGRPVED